MKSTEIRKRFLDFFAKRGHAIIPSASLIPQNDPSVLFNTAGMQQFKPYYTGDKSAQIDFGAVNVATVQKCVRTGDIDEAGDATHLTFFEMLGNFSFGGYWKKEAIGYAHEFITKEMGLTIDYVSIFKDDESGIPADEESRLIWQSIDPSLTIKEHNREDNFWGPTGDEGPCGPTTEIYINGVEVWNIVFNEFYKTKEGEFKSLETKGIDTGMGLERLAIAMQEKDNIFETDLFTTVMNFIFTNTRKEEYDLRSARIVADHIRSATFLIADGVSPSNKDQGYILRRLIRRAVVQADALGLTQGILVTARGFFADQYKDQYPELESGLGTQHDIFKNELEKFQKTLEAGLKEYKRVSEGKDIITSSRAFNLYSSQGLPIDVIVDLAKADGKQVDIDGFNVEMKAHQETSRAGAEQKFKGGLANTSEQTTKLHTAHHLLLKALQEIVSPDIHQKGSNITEERLRIDFNFDRKLTDEEKTAVEERVNTWIAYDLNVIKRDMPKEEAEKLGAEMEFGVKYPDIVSVYFIEDKEGNHVSKEFCGGPHVERTGVLGIFKIQKEEASSAGVRRIKAVLL